MTDDSSRDFSGAVNPLSSSPLERGEKYCTHPDYSDWDGSGPEPRPRKVAPAQSADRPGGAVTHAIDRAFAKCPATAPGRRWIASFLDELDAVPTIDSVPSCGQENDYRRASVPRSDAVSGELARKAALFREGTRRIYEGQGDRADMWFFELWHFLGDVHAALQLPLNRESVVEEDVQLWGALCNYLNQVGDPFDPREQWQEFCSRGLKRLSAAYEAWHVAHKAEFDRSLSSGGRS